MIPSKTVFLLPCKAGRHIKPLWGLRHPRELHSVPTPVTNVTVSFISLRKSLRWGRLISRLSNSGFICAFLLTALTEELEKLKLSHVLVFLEVIIK